VHGSSNSKKQLIMKNLMTCSIDELLTEKQNAIEVGNIDRYRECNELISTWSMNIAKKLNIEVIFNDLAKDCDYQFSYDSEQFDSNGRRKF
jgi:hypothetical protein